MDELIEGVGAVDRTAALKALITWIDLGVLKEDEENTFRLLEVTEEAGPSSRTGNDTPPSAFLR
jgi:anaphase-promoting complex subunit 2